MHVVSQFEALTTEPDSNSELDILPNASSTQKLLPRIATIAVLVALKK